MDLLGKVKEAYQDAEQIVVLRRSKVKKPLARALDALVCLLTPMPEITETADLISDLGLYCLVERGGRQLLVRADREGIEEKEITGLCAGKSFEYEGNRFVKQVKLNG